MPTQAPTGSDARINCLRTRFSRETPASGGLRQNFDEALADFPALPGFEHSIKNSGAVARQDSCGPPRVRAAVASFKYLVRSWERTGSGREHLCPAMSPRRVWGVRRV